MSIQNSTIPANEKERLSALLNLRILDTGPEEDFDDIVNLAAQICDVPIALIAFIDRKRAWFKAKKGLEITEVPREESFCTYHLDNNDLVIIPDVSAEMEFSGTSAIKGHNLRFYAAIPIVLENDLVIGNLCVLDLHPRTLTKTQSNGLRILGRQIGKLLNLRSEVNKVSEINQVLSHETDESNRNLHKQKEFYENILNKLPTDIVVFNPEHKYIFANPGAIKNDEFRKYIIGKDDFEYAAYRNRDTSIAEMRRKQFLEIKNNAKEIRWEDSLKDPEGNTITHLRRLFPVYDDKGELAMVIGFGIDITDRKHLEEKQTEMLAQLSAQNVQLVDFCNIVSHNLRAPLVNMSMLAKFIEESQDDAERKLLISKLNPVIESIHSTFNELVESIQIKQDLEVSSEQVCLRDCLERTKEGLRAEVDKSEAVIELNITEANKIHSPPKYMFSIFHNLLSNALKYQSPKRKPHIIIRTTRREDKIILSIQDNGLGMDLTKHKDNLFKIGKVFHRNPDGKGFGLFMTKTQVEAMGGKIWAESTPDEGSTFYIEFANQN
ncbi:MAG: hypothetical protein K0S09_405 [Sphingobacteriaceae bacterium]|nr:hypothetical protein [Sphingobacteriaceae bacterium]